MSPAGARIDEILDAVMNETARRRVLAIDYGRKRIGLAISDEQGLTAQPFLTLVRTNRQNDLRRLREICRGHGVAQIVVGHPVRMSGETGTTAQEAARFAARLQKELGIPVDLQDERLTSWEAEQMIAEMKPSQRRKRGPLDAVAAAIVLREYLERKRRVPNATPTKKD